MKHYLSTLVITACLSLSASANAALDLMIIEFRMATLVSDFSEPFESCYLSIPTGIDYFIDPTYPISIDPPVSQDGLDWIHIYKSDIMEVPANPLVTIYLTDIEVFIDGPGDYTLTLWDDTGSAQLGSLGVNVPEPATIALLGLGGLALVWKRTR